MNTTYNKGLLMMLSCLLLIALIILPASNASGNTSNLPEETLTLDDDIVLEIIAPPHFGE
ncbi:MAG: hypothetical protein LBB91_06475 [Clostridiales bacterium]|jgi:hypothetical protein|nr:hypothetical protein [Clostridiales bacterium]